MSADLGRLVRKMAAESPLVNAGNVKTHPNLDGDPEWFQWRRRIAEADPYGDGLAWLLAADWLDEHHCPALAFIIRCGNRKVTYDLTPSLFTQQHHPSQDVLNDMARESGFEAPRADALEPFNVDLPGTLGPRVSTVTIKYVVRCALADSVTVPNFMMWHRHGSAVVRHRYAAIRWALVDGLAPRLVEYTGGAFPGAYVLMPRDTWVSHRIGPSVTDYQIPRAILPFMANKVFDGTNHPSAPDGRILRGMFPAADRLVYLDADSARIDVSRGMVGWALAQKVK